MALLNSKVDRIGEVSAPQNFEYLFKISYLHPESEKYFSVYKVKENKKDKLVLHNFEDNKYLSFEIINNSFDDAKELTELIVSGNEEQAGSKKAEITDKYFSMIENYKPHDPLYKNDGRCNGFLSL